MTEEITPEQLAEAKHILAVASGKKRWAGVSKAERSALARKAALARAAKKDDKLRRAKLASEARMRLPPEKRSELAATGGPKGGRPKKKAAKKRRKSG